MSVADYERGVLAGERAILGRAITLIESARPEHQKRAQELLVRLLPHSGGFRRVGITGVPGVGPDHDRGRGAGLAAPESASEVDVVVGGGGASEPVPARSAGGGAAAGIGGAGGLGRDHAHVGGEPSAGALRGPMSRVVRSVFGPVRSLNRQLAL
ncbi:MAG: hypothetical protein GY856_28905 [bacterium]|nr:hypothetical protein [bacterium]